MYLFINTAFFNLELAFFNENKLIFYRKWQSKQEMIDLIEIISELDLDQIMGVIVSKGPGRFMSLRVGVAYAQTLAYFKKVPIYAFSSYEYFQTIKNNNLKDMVFVQQITLNELFLNNKIVKFDDLVNIDTNWLGDIRTKHLLPNLWQEENIPAVDLDFLLRLKNQLSVCEQVKIEYGKNAY